MCFTTNYKFHYLFFNKEDPKHAHITYLFALMTSSQIFNSKKSKPKDEKSQRYYEVEKSNQILSKGCMNELFYE